MGSGNGMSLESVHQELEKLGSLVRSLSTQIASVRVRVSDLEHWDTGLASPGTRRGELKLMAKDAIKGNLPKRPGTGPKGPGTGPSKGPGTGPGKSQGRGPSKGPGKGRGKGN